MDQNSFYVANLRGKNELVTIEYVCKCEIQLNQQHINQISSCEICRIF